MIKLSICIPTKNRLNTLIASLDRICRLAGENSRYIEVVIGDNSNDDLTQVLKEIFNGTCSIKLNYINNKKDIGLARNYLNIVKQASGEFCWILGDDDFIEENSISKILEIIDKKKYELIAFNYKVLRIDKDDDTVAILNKINNKEGLYSNPKIGKSFESDNFFDLINHNFHNVYLGSMMTFVFSKKVWESKPELIHNDLDYNFTNYFGIYPHVYILANSINKSTVYYND